MATPLLQRVVIGAPSQENKTKQTQEMSEECRNLLDQMNELKQNGEGVHRELHLRCWKSAPNSMIPKLIENEWKLDSTVGWAPSSYKVSNSAWLYRIWLMCCV